MPFIAPAYFLAHHHETRIGVCMPELLLSTVNFACVTINAKVIDVAELLMANCRAEQLLSVAELLNHHSKHFHLLPKT